MEFDGAGWVDQARHVPSPNADERPPGTVVDTVVIHHISLPPEHFRGDAVERFFTNCLDHGSHPYFDRLRGLHVSAHFLLRRHGGLLQFVGCERRAWHAGESSLRGRQRCNDFSIGIELEGSSRRPFTRRQYRRLAMLIAAARRRYPLRFIAGHSDIAPGRKDDPGPFFDWRELDAVLQATGIERPF
jgi:N-acetyl-anhydromuramoyl-L-alanine amidase